MIRGNNRPRWVSRKTDIICTDRHERKDMKFQILLLRVCEVALHFCVLREGGMLLQKNNARK